MRAEQEKEETRMRAGQQQLKEAFEREQGKGAGKVRVLGVGCGEGGGAEATQEGT